MPDKILDFIPSSEDPKKKAAPGKPAAELVPDTAATSGAINFGEPTHVNIDAYKKYFPEGVNSSWDLDKIRAQRQGWGEQLLKTVGNTIVNIPLGIVEGAGYIGELFSPGDNDYDNLLISTMDSWKNPFGEVYRENPEKVFDLGDPAWWFNNIGGLVESVAEFAVPGAVVGKGLSKFAQMASMAAKGTRGANAIAAGLNTAARTGTAATLAYMEGAMSGRQIYKEVYQEQFSRLTGEGLDPVEANHEARKLASQGAAATVRLNTSVNTAMNFVSLAPFFRNSENKIRQWISTEGRKLPGETNAVWKARIMKAAEENPAMKQILAKPSMALYFPGMVAEGIEEVNTQYAEETGREIGGIRAKSGLNLLADYFDKVSNQEGLLNFALGAVGGMGQTALLQTLPVHKIAKFDADGNPLLKPGTEDQFQTKRVSARTRDAVQKQRYFDSIKDALVADIDWYAKKNAELEKAVAENKPLEAKRIRTEMLTAHNLNAVMHGNATNWKQEYEDIAGIDNSKDLGVEVKAQIDELTAQLQQLEAQQADTTAIHQQLEGLQKQFDQVNGKTAAMVKGYAYDKNDNEYKEKAIQAAKDVEWMDKLHADMRRRYVRDDVPHSEELADFIFARTVEHDLNKRMIAEEETQLAKDEILMRDIDQFNNKAAVSNDVARKLNNDVENLRKAAKDNNIAEVKRLLNKYKIPVQDSALAEAVNRLISTLNNRVEAHKAIALENKQALESTPEFATWSERNPGKGFSDFMEYVKDTSPINPEFMERRRELQMMKEQYDIDEASLGEAKSSKGRLAFVKAAKADKKLWEARQNMRNAAQLKEVLEKKYGKEMAARINRVNVEKRIRDTAEKIQELEKQLADLTAQRNKLIEQSKATDKKAFFANLAKKAGNLFDRQNIRELSDQIDSVQEQIRRLKALQAQLQEQLQESQTIEEKVKEETVPEIQTKPVAKAADPVQQLSAKQTLIRTALDNREIQQAQFVAMAEAALKDDTLAIELFEQVKTQLQNLVASSAGTVSEQSLVEAYGPTIVEAVKQQMPAPAVKPQQFASYEELTKTVPGEVLDILDNIELLQRQAMEAGEAYSYDLGLRMMEPAVANQLISEETAYRAIVLQKEMIDAMNSEPLPPVTQAPVPTSVTTTAIQDPQVENPGETMIPVIDGILSIEDASSDEMAKHFTLKTHTAAKVNTASIEYREIAKGEEVVDPDTGKRVKLKSYMFIPLYEMLDEKANHNILKPGFIREGDAIEFVVDTEFNGEINYDSMLVNDEYGKKKKRADSFGDHTTAEGKIILNSEYEGYANVPIKIVHARTGQVIGYVPRTDWITSRYENAVDYRNLRNIIYDAMGNVITDNNVEEQKQRLLSMRLKIAKAFNEGSGQTFTTTVDNIRPGHIFYNTKVNFNTERWDVVSRQSKNMLPDNSLKIGMINNGTVFVGSQSPYSGTRNWDEKELKARFGKVTNQPVVLLPMPNGAMSVAPLESVKLENRTADTFTVARVIEAYLASGTDQFTEFHQKLVDKIYEVTSHNKTSRPLDITNEKDLELFINQYFTYTQAFREDYHTMADRPAGSTESKKPRFMLHIPEAFGNKKSKIKMGVSWSGAPAMFAELKDGKLDPDFEEQLIAGLSTHYKSIVYSKGDLRGLNHSGPFNTIVVTKGQDSKGDWIIKTKSYDNYNEYVKENTTTYAYGKHRIGNDGKPSDSGTYVYGANPVIEFDMDKVIEEPLVRKVSPTDIAEPEPMGTGDPLLDAGLEVFEDLFFGDEAVIVDSTGTIEGALPATLENLANLQLSTPANKRNSKSPEEVLAEMHSNGITQIAPDFNPFLKC